jgi:LacI family transcriptional regulator
MPTILDVARLADVSIATVSRVMNGDPAVRPATRRSVQNAISELNYRPNAAARSLRLSRSQTLGLVVPDLSNPIFSDVVHGIEPVARARGYSLFLCDTGNDPEAESMHLERLYERRVDGVIFYAIGKAPPALNRFLDTTTPVVAMGPAAFECTLSGVLVNERTATVAAVRRLIELGHTRIGMIHRDTPPGRYLYRTWVIRKEMIAAGVPWVRRMLVNADTGDQAREQTTALIRDQGATAIVALSYPYAPYVLQAVYDIGLRIPEDVSVLAYGDSAWAIAHRPPISAVRIDYQAWGRETAELLLRRIEAPLAKPRKIRREAQFIERASLGAAVRSG